MAINMGNKQVIKNIFMNILAFAVQFFTSFYIAPLIVSKVGASAYGFIGLSNDFISYASILTSVFNSVAARFIANEFYKKNYDRANKYFNSLIAANFFIAMIIGILGIGFSLYIDRVLSVPAELLFDVKLAFIIVFVSYCFSLVTMVFTTSTFVTNRTDIQGVRNIVTNIIRFALTIVFLNLISVKIYWISVSALIAGVVSAIWNITLTKKLLPEIHITLHNAKFKYAMELGKAGCWMAFTSISVILMRGLDLTIANLFLGAHEMGLMSVARTMPNNMTSVINTIAPIFTPVFIACFAKNDFNSLVMRVKKSINIIAVLLYVPICGFIVYSYNFYSLWQRSLSQADLHIVSIISIITIVQAIFNSSTATMAQLSVVVNKLKIPVFVSFGTGALNIIAVIVLLKLTKLGVFAIVISSTVITVARYILFNSFYAARILNKKPGVFIWSAIKTWMIVPILLLVFIVIKKIIPVHSWTTFGISVAISAVIGYIIMMVVFVRHDILKILKKKL